MSFWNYIVVCLSLLLLATLLWWEIKRSNKARLTGRIIATVLLVASLAAIALPVTYTSRGTAGSGEGVLLTEGYDPDSARICSAPSRIAGDSLRGSVRNAEPQPP